MALDSMAKGSAGEAALAALTAACAFLVTAKVIKKISSLKWLFVVG